MFSNTLNEKDIWKAVQAEMRVNFSDLHYNMHISRMLLKELTEDTALILCPDKQTLQKAETHYCAFLQESINKIAKGKYEVKFKIGTEKKELTEKDVKGTLFEDVPLQPDILAKNQKNGLNPHYRLDNYVMGNTNQLAFAIASAISAEPGKKYNPFFLYAGVGLGKTHLIQAVGNTVLRNNPNAKVIYVTSENFTNELVDSIRGKSKNPYATETFRKKYRSADVLIIDDIQFITGKDGTQEEFFHTFNELYLNQKQIVLASDRPPEEFKNIEERITSRFKSGMMADIQPPDYELRTAILRAKRDEDKDSVPNEVIGFIAEHIDTNIRELEGAYLQVLAFASTRNKPLDLEIAKEALANVVKNEPKKSANVTNIIKAVCNYYSVKQMDLKGKRRTKDLVIPRQVAMYLMYDLTGTPYMGIGEVLGGRDHTTIMHGYEKVKGELENSMVLKKDVMNIKQIIYQ
jgi:chromosomal replication initiator protein